MCVCVCVCVCVCIYIEREREILDFTRITKIETEIKINKT